MKKEKWEDVTDITQSTIDREPFISIRRGAIGFSSNACMLVDAKKYKYVNVMKKSENGKVTGLAFVFTNDIKDGSLNILDNETIKTTHVCSRELVDMFWGKVSKAKRLDVEKEIINGKNALVIKL